MAFHLTCRERWCTSCRAAGGAAQTQSRPWLSAVRTPRTTRSTSMIGMNPALVLGIPRSLQGRYRFNGLYSCSSWTLHIRRCLRGFGPSVLYLGDKRWEFFCIKIVRTRADQKESHFTTAYIPPLASCRDRSSSAGRPSFIAVAEVYWGYIGD